MMVCISENVALQAVIERILSKLVVSLRFECLVEMFLHWYNSLVDSLTARFSYHEETSTSRSAIFHLCPTLSWDIWRLSQLELSRFALIHSNSARWLTVWFFSRPPLGIITFLDELGLQPFFVWLIFKMRKLLRSSYWWLLFWRLNQFALFLRLLHNFFMFFSETFLHLLVFQTEWRWIWRVTSL